MTFEQDFTTSLFQLMGETFEEPIGIFLDRNTSLFQTLETISAQEASIPVGGKCASLAAQVAHITFHLEVLERYIVNHDTNRVDWGEIWRTVEKVTPGEWDLLRDKLRQAYQHLGMLLRGNKVWDENAIGGSLSIVVHAAYHLGEIRQALCTLRQ